MSWSVIQASLPAFGAAFWLTLELAALGIAGALGIGAGVSLVQYFRVPGLHQVASVYVDVARNTPLLVQLFFIYYGLPGLGLKLSAPVSGVLGLIFLGGSYMAEAFTGGYNAIPKSQLESGAALGLSPRQLARFIVLPQGLTAAVPGLAANVIFLVKETSIFTVIAIPELTNTALDLIGLYYRSNESLLMLVVAYAIILVPLSWGLTQLERKVRHVTIGA
ncbi:amino acid ABC transporter permease [Lacticaseibacillus daqingensis]|uniref:amino acid ABC transporter permease n=1 Tax=Lacticaseibacillus daqingensis TaxID=2486014 RepID=UPI000F7AE4A2|nr:amino acid ABC transporter permease [Lacticaseibacillus daqingensis]